MARVVDRNELKRMLANENVQLIEVLPHDEYEAEHITGAVNVPLRELNLEAAKNLDRSRPIVVYCHDFT